MPTASTAPRRTALTISLALLLSACNTTPDPTAASNPAPSKSQSPLNTQAVTGTEMIASSVARNPDGSLELFTRSSDNQIYHRWQQGAGGAWTNWSSLGGNMNSDPVAVAGADGKLVLFAQGQDNAIWLMKQDFTTQTGWTPWTKLGGSAASAPQAARNTEGNLEVFYRGTDNALWHAWETAPGGAWSSVASLGQNFSRDPSVIVNSAGRLQVFVVANQQGLWHIQQDYSTQTGWTAWKNQGGQYTSGPFAAKNADGRLEIFLRGLDNAVWHWWENSPGGSWAAEAWLGGTWAGKPAVALDANNRLDVYARSTSGDLQHNWQTFNVGDGWSGWNTLGGNLTSDPVVTRLGDGRLQVFARAADGSFQTRTQTAPAGPNWTAWVSLGSPSTGNGGGTGGTPDTTPDAFTFNAVTGQALNTDVTSNTITVTGINAPAAISVSGGTLVINGQTSTATTVSQGNTVAVRLRTGSSAGSTTSATVSIGGVSSTFRATTTGATTNLSLAARMLASSNYYTRDLTSAPIDGNSANMMTKFRNDLASRVNYPEYGGGVVVDNPFGYTASFYTVDASTPRYTVAFNDCQRKGFTPDELYKAGNLQVFVNVPIPSNAKPSDGTDGHMALYSPSTNQLWELWVAAKNSSTGVWSACWGGRIDNLSQNPGVYPGSTGVTASGMVFPAAMITLDEVRQGAINHAIYMALAANTAPNFTWDDPNSIAANYHVWPAVRNDGKGTDPNAIPEGAYLRLDPSVNVDALDLTPFAKMVAKAAQKYGFVVMDKAGATNVGLEDPRRDMAERGSSVNSWVELFGVTNNQGQRDWDWFVMRNFPWDKVSVLKREYGKPQ